MADRVRQPDTAALLGRPGAEPVDSVAELAARNELQDFALQARAGVVGVGSAVLPSLTNGFANLISDADFEGAVLNPAWELNSGGGGAVALSTAHAFNGLQSMQLSGGNSIATYGLEVGTQIPFLTIGVGQAVYFSTYMMTDDPAGSLVSINIVFTDANGVVTGGFRTSGDQINLASGWVQQQASARAPTGTVYFYVAVIYQSTDAAKSLFIDTALLMQTNTEGGPITTSPTDSGQRLDIAGSLVTAHTGHHLESVGGAITFDTVMRVIGTPAADVGLLKLLAPLLGGAGPELDMYSASSDGSQKSTIELHSTVASIFGALGLKGGLDSSSFVVSTYAPANINPVLSAAGGANAGASSTVATITDRKVAILALHFVSLATVNNTATNIQHVQSDIQISTDGGTSFSAGTGIPTACVGTSIDRVVCPSFNLITATPTGAIKVLPKVTWSTTVTVGAGGSANLQTFNSFTITFVVAVA